MSLLNNLSSKESFYHSKVPFYCYSLFLLKIEVACINLTKQNSCHHFYSLIDDLIKTYFPTYFQCKSRLHQLLEEMLFVLKIVMKTLSFIF